MKVKFYLARFIRQLWASIAFLLVFFAIVLTAIRLGLPYIGHYKVEITQWFETTFNQPISVDLINADWHHNGPAIQLSNFQFITADSQSNAQPNIQQAPSPIMINIANVNLEIDFWQSISQQDLIVRNFVLDGVDIKIDIASLKATQNNNTDIVIIDLLKDIFLKQFKRFDLQNSQITLLMPDSTEHIFQIKILNWFNQDKLHQGVGEFTLKGIENDELDFVLSLTDAPNQKLNGQLYTQSEGINFVTWLKPYLANDATELQSKIAFESWLSIKNSQFEQLIFNFLPSQLSWNSLEQAHLFQLNSGQIQADFKHNKQRLKVNQLTLSDDKETWQPIDFQFELDPTHWAVYVPKLDLRPFKNLISLIKTPSIAQRFANKLTAEPQLENIYAWQYKQQDWQLHAQLSQLNWRSFGRLPEMNGLTGHFSLSPKTMVGDWQIQQTDLAWPGLFEQPLNVKNVQFSSILKLEKANQWTFKIPNLKVDLEQASAQAEILVRPDQQGREGTELLVFTELSEAKVSDAQLFLPKKLMGANTYDYLVQALQAGHVSGGQLIWQGNLGLYPYAYNEGIFKAAIQTQNATFEFLPSWPAVTELDLNLTFINEGLYFNTQKGRLLDAQIKSLNAGIAQLSSPDVKLELFADIKATGQSATQVMQAGSLKNSVGKALETLIVTGDLSANLKLMIPLRDAQKVNASGEILFNDNQLEIKPVDFHFQRINGLLEFNMDQLKADKLTFDWGVVPYQIDLKAMQADNLYQIGIDLRGNWPLAAILTQTGYLSLADRVKGSAATNGYLNINLPSTGFEYQLDVASDLYGVQLNLPKPYGKLAAIPNNVNFSMSGDINSSTLELNYGQGMGQSADKSLKFSAVLPHNQTGFSRAYLVLGDEVLSSPAQGFNISAYLDKVDISEYLSFITDLNHDLSSSNPQISATSSNPSILSEPQRIRGEVKQLALGPLTWHAVNFNTELQDQFWTTEVVSDEFKGDITIYKALQELGVDINAERFVLHSSKPTSKPNTQSSNNPKTPLNTELTDSQIKDLYQQIPPVSFYCASCFWDKKQLGEVQFKLLRDSNAYLNLYDFNLKYRMHAIKASGLWALTENNQHKTSINGNISSRDFGLWLKDYEFSTAIRDSSLSSTFNVNWANTPMAFNTALLNGDMSWRLGQGHLADVSDKGARILSLLSIDSLVRKLKLDFRDVFSKGLFYNEMKGDVRFVNGIAYSENTKMDGVPGNMDIVGKTNLVTQTLDYNVKFSPKVTSSIPIILAWMVNPVTGIAALAIDQAIESADVISQIEFSIQGTIDKPEVVETGRQSKAIKLKTSKTDKTKPQTNEITSETEKNTAVESENKAKTKPLNEEMSDKEAAN